MRYHRISKDFTPANISIRIASKTFETEHLKVVHLATIMALLGIECGATISRAILQWESKEEIFHFKPTNFKILRDGELERILKDLKVKVEGHLGVKSTLDKVAIGLGGVTTTEDRAVSH